MSKQQETGTPQGPAWEKFHKAHKAKMAKSKALEGAKDNLPRKTVTSTQHKKIMREQGTEKYGK